MVVVDVTDENGEINIEDISGYGDIIISVTELEAADHRRCDDKVKTAYFTRERISGRFKLNESDNVDTYIDNVNNHVTVGVRNKLEAGKYTLVLEKQNEDGSAALQGAKFRIAIPELDVIEDATDITGKIYLNGLDMPDEPREVTAVITEIEPPLGYKSLDRSIFVKITFGAGDETIGEDPIIIKNVEIIDDEDNVASIDKYADQYIKVDIKNKAIEKENLYDVIISKREKLSNPDMAPITLKGVLFEITLQYEDGTAVFVTRKTDENGNITISDLFNDGLLEVTVKEVETVNGYKLDSKPRKVTATIEPESLDIAINDVEDGLKASVTGRDLQIVMENEVDDEKVDLHIEKFITKVNDTVITDREPTAVYKGNNEFVFAKNGAPLVLKNGDIVEFTIRVYNKGNLDGYASKVADYLPEGLQYIDEVPLNINYGWYYVSDKVIKGFDGTTISYQDVKIVAKVDFDGSKTLNADNIAILTEIQNADKEIIEETGSYEYDNAKAEGFSVEPKKEESSGEMEQGETEGKPDGDNNGKPINGDVEEKPIEGENGGIIHGDNDGRLNPNGDIDIIGEYEEKGGRIKDIESIDYNNNGYKGHNGNNGDADVFENGSAIKDVKVRTGDNITIYFIEIVVGIVSLAIIVVFVYKKKEENK